MNETLTDLVHIWNKVLQDLEQKIDDRRLFDAFLHDSKIHSIDGNRMNVIVSSALSATLLTNKYLKDVESSVKNITQASYKVVFDTEENFKPVEKKAEIKVDESEYFKYASIDKSLTFDNFVTGKCNLEAKQAALYATSNPGSKGVNPLFIHSDSGLGKTHLLSAIANTFRETQAKKVVYCSASDFLDEIVRLRESAGFDKFKAFILSHDILLIDDIQMLADKEKTNTFFFEVFQAMYNKGKQIVITSDKHPVELKGFDERLKSRFAGGLTIEIKSPDIDTCIAILKSKIASTPIPLSAFDEDVLTFIAEKFSKNIRYIDEALKKLVFYTISFKPTQHINMEVTLEALGNSLNVRVEKQRISEKRIIEIVADYYNLTPSQLTGSSRQGQIALARHISMYLIRYMLNIPFTKIGTTFGGKDHSTVMNGVEKVENELKNNTLLQESIAELKKRLKS